MAEELRTHINLIESDIRYQEKKKMSEELDVHLTRLSWTINNYETPDIEFIYRLGEHSGALIPTLTWLKLLK